jgi:hypothetical protein
MSQPTLLIPIGDDAGILFPDGMLARLGWSLEDALVATVTEEGVGLTKQSSQTEPQLKPARVVSGRRRAALKKPGE